MLSAQVASWRKQQSCSAGWQWVYIQPVCSGHNSVSRVSTGRACSICLHSLTWLIAVSLKLYLLSENSCQVLGLEILVVTKCAAWVVDHLLVTESSVLHAAQSMMLHPLECMPAHIFFVKNQGANNVRWSAAPPPVRPAAKPGPWCIRIASLFLSKVVEATKPLADDGVRKGRVQGLVLRASCRQAEW